MIQITNNINAEKARAPEINHWFKHNERAHELENVNPALTHLNDEFLKALFPNFKNPKPQDLLLEIQNLKQTHNLKNNDAVPFVKVVSTFNPQNQNPTPEELKKWALAEIDFLKKEWGDENIKAVYFHLDEATPHFHILVSTFQTAKFKNKEVYFITQPDGSKTQIKATERKQKRAEGFKVQREIIQTAEKTAGFNAAKWFYNRDSLKSMKQRHADFLKSRNFEIVKAEPSLIAVNHIKEYKKHIQLIEALFPKEQLPTLKSFLNKIIWNVRQTPTSQNYQAQLKALFEVFPELKKNQLQEIEELINLQLEESIKIKNKTSSIDWKFSK